MKNSNVIRGPRVETNWFPSRIFLNRFIALFGFILTIACFYPGYMSFDSYVQLSQARTGEFTDWHPPIMSSLWSLTDSIVEGPLGMLILQVFFIWFALYRLSSSVESQQKSLLILGIGFLPFVVNFQGVIWKDVQMVAALLIALTFFNTKMSVSRILLILLCLFYAWSVRTNALFAVIPLIAFFYSFSLRKRQLATIGYTILTATIFTASNFLITYVLLDSESVHLQRIMQVDDLYALSVADKKSYIPNVSYEDIAACKDNSLGESVLFQKYWCLSHLPNTTNSPLSNSLTKEWVSGVIRSPLVLADYRVKKFSFFIRSTDEKPFSIEQPGQSYDEIGVVFQPNIFSGFLSSYVKNASIIAPFFFKPSFYLVLNFVLLYLVSRKKNDYQVSLARSLGLSSICSFAGLYFLVPSGDFRYIYWNIFATILGLILVSGKKKIDLARAINLKFIVTLFCSISVVLIADFSGRTF